MSGGLRAVGKAAMQPAMSAPDPDRLLAEISQMIVRFAPPGAPIERRTELTSDLSIDSVAAMDLVMEIEDRYGIDVPVNEIADLLTVGDLVDLVARQLGARG